LVGFIEGGGVGIGVGDTAGIVFRGITTGILTDGVHVNGITGAVRFALITGIETLVGFVGGDASGTTGLVGTTIGSRVVITGLVDRTHVGSVLEKEGIQG